MCELWKHGRPGEPIPGSRYVRAYCPDCGEAMRVSLETWECESPMRPCLECDPLREATYSTIAAAHRHAERTPDDTTDPSWDNAVRTLEGCR